jgi:hypothetical protein
MSVGIREPIRRKIMKQMRRIENPYIIVKGKWVPEVRIIGCRHPIKNWRRTNAPVQVAYQPWDGGPWQRTNMRVKDLEGRIVTHVDAEFAKFWAVGQPFTF